MRLPRRAWILSLVLVGVLGAAFRRPLQAVALGLVQRVKGRKTVAQRLQQFEEPVRQKLATELQLANLEWPPARLALLAFKHEKVLEVWGAAAGVDAPFRRIKRYPILGASGIVGPKLAEGDGQVPEGLYRIESLNPNSAFHLALRVGYPNDFDRRMAAADGRSELGSDIMIHGSTASIGCLAMGDPVAEELFVLAAKAGVENVSIIISPVDFRARELLPVMPRLPAWTGELYAEIRRALMPFRERPSPRP